MTVTVVYKMLCLLHFQKVENTNFSLDQPKISVNEASPDLFSVSAEASEHVW